MTLASKSLSETETFEICREGWAGWVLGLFDHSVTPHKGVQYDETFFFCF